jgi:hypothetical protein
LGVALGLRACHYCADNNPSLHDRTFSNQGSFGGGELKRKKMSDKPKIERALFPQIAEEFTAKAVIEDENGKDFTIKFIGSVDDCNDWLSKVARTFSVLKYEIIFVKAIVEMV